jgi:acetyl esterase/lipase
MGRLLRLSAFLAVLFAVLAVAVVRIEPVRCGAANWAFSLGGLVQLWQPVEAPDISVAARTMTLTLRLLQPPANASLEELQRSRVLLAPLAACLPADTQTWRFLLNDQSQGLAIEMIFVSPAAAAPLSFSSPVPRAIIWLHGGWLAGGGARADLRLLGALAREADAVVVAPDYPPLPGAPLATLLHLVSSTRDFLVKVRKVPPAQIAVAGAGSGAHLAMLYTQAVKASKERPSALWLLSPAAHDYALRLPLAKWSSGRRAPSLDSALLPAHFDLVQKAMLADSNNTALLRTLLEDDFKGFPPTYISTGALDPLLSGANTYESKLRKAGVAVVYQPQPHLGHMFARWPNLVPEGAAELARVGTWLRKSLGAPAGAAAA